VQAVTLSKFRERERDKKKRVKFIPQICSKKKREEGTKNTLATKSKREGSDG